MPRNRRPVENVHFTTRPNQTYAQGRYDRDGGGTREAPLQLDQYSPILHPGQTPQGLVVLTHGGGLSKGSREDNQGVKVAQRFAAAGYEALVISYRLLRDGRENVTPTLAPEYEPMLRDQLAQAADAIAAGRFTRAQIRGLSTASEDIVAALRWAEQGDPTLFQRKVLLFGESAGAVASLNVGFVLDRYPAIRVPRIDAVLAFSGLMLAPVEIDADDPALVLVHGTADDKVRIAESRRLEAQARAVGIPVAFFPLEGGGHNSIAALRRPLGPGRPILFDEIMGFIGRLPVRR